MKLLKILFDINPTFPNFHIRRFLLKGLFVGIHDEIVENTVFPIHHTYFIL